MLTEATTRLLAPGPLLQLLDRLVSDLCVLERVTPNGDVALAMRGIVSSLRTAIEAAADVDEWMSIEQLEHLIQRPQSTLRRLCQTKTKEIGARKVAGVWSIHWPTFEKYLNADNLNPLDSAA